jgi:hypothetical protein
VPTVAAAASRGWNHYRRTHVLGNAGIVGVLGTGVHAVGFAIVVWIGSVGTKLTQVVGIGRAGIQVVTDGIAVLIGTGTVTVGIARAGIYRVADVVLIGIAALVAKVVRIGGAAIAAVTDAIVVPIVTAAAVIVGVVRTRIVGVTNSVLV